MSELDLVAEPTVVLGVFLAFTKLDSLFSSDRCAAGGKQQLATAC